MSYSEITNNIKISVLPQPLADQSQPALKRFAFSYTVTIENLGEKPVQLLERYWIVKSNGVPLAEVVGPGVVGEQPEIDSGGEFTYTSGAVIEDPIGSMQGKYTFRTTDGHYIEANIPCFDLLYPTALH